MRRLPCLFSSLMISLALHAQQPLAAHDILQQAMTQAATEKKNVLIIFHASWCGWCHKMDSSINDKSCKKFFDENFVIRHLVVDESRDKKNLENPGAYELRTKYHGDNQGIPYWLIFDKDGNLLADSQARPDGAGLDSKGDNVGCPASEKEVDYFIQVLKKTSHLTSEEQAAIEKRFRQNED
jgi:thiol-disulfide isomerase/thioredoxin